MKTKSIHLSTAALILCGALLLIPSRQARATFLDETFEECTLGEHLAASGSKKWSMWPRDAAASDTIVANPKKPGEKALEMKNNAADACCFNVIGGENWKQAVTESRKATLKFGFFISSTSPVVGGFGACINQVNGTNPRQGSAISVQDWGNGKRVILAVNGIKPDGSPKFVKVGEWNYDEWQEVALDMNFEDKTYSVGINGQGASLDGLAFRAADAWDGNTWGDRAQIVFSIPKENTVLLDNVQCSAEGF